MDDEDYDSDDEAMMDDDFDGCQPLTQHTHSLSPAIHLNINAKSPPNPPLFEVLLIL